jgi:hypothetical protein
MRPTERSLWKTVEIATAMGATLMVAFWALYFLANDTLRLVDPAVASFEETFIVADSMLAVLLVVAAVHLHRRRVAGPFLLVAASAMCLYLGALDATFYTKSGGGLGQLLAPALCVGGGLFGLVAGWLLWRSI